MPVVHSLTLYLYSMIPFMDQTAFLKAYSTLNTEQKQAVDAIEGPVMVIAGPGTGKTQILTLRIANILRNADINPQNILAITFTEAGVAAMRKRLAALIGSTAYHVTITTFHGFCNDLIKNSPEEFPRIIGAQNISEIDQIALLETIIKEAHLDLLKPFGDPLFYVRPALSAINQLKREGIEPEAFAKIIEEETEGFSAIEDLYHEKGPHKGKMKGDYQKLEKMLAKNKELWVIYQSYQQTLTQKRLYDYNDMILEVLSLLRTNEDVLLTLQETYQYVLVDEHQDTNNAQNKILELLVNFHDNPNLFVVGDEKQAIYRFQGASLENFLYFKQLYPSALLINLKNNYRSHQTILDAAHSLMPKSTPLTAHASHPLAKVEVCALPNADTEYYFLAQNIKEKLAQGIEPRQIAILYRNNSDAFPVSRMLEKVGIAHTIESDQDILADNDIKNLVLLLYTLHHFGDAGYLLKALHMNILRVTPLDIFKITETASKQKINPYDILRSPELLSKAEVSEPEALHALYTKLSTWRTTFSEEHFDRAFEVLIHDSGMLAHLLAQPDALEKLQKLQVLFRHIRQLMDRNPQFSLEDITHYIDRLNTHGILIKYTPDHTAQGVRLMTAHKSKGLEFDQVYVINAVDGHWGNKRRIEFLKLPPRVYSLLNSNITKDTSDADERNLFYVAVTRAKKGLTITYAQQGADNREQLPSQFIGELDPNTLEYPNIDSYSQMFAKEPQILFTPAPRTYDLANIQTYVKDIFVRNGLAVTALNNYLECPWKYFYVNLLRLPQAQSKQQLYGIAIHRALKEFFDNALEGIPPLETLLANFHASLAQLPLEEKELEELLTKGTKALTGYYRTYHTNWRKNTLNELSIRGIELTSEIRLTGQLDKLEFTDASGKNVNVVDYKTGKPKSRKELSGETKNSDGAYKRQLVFYNLLLNSFLEGKYNMVSGEIDFVEPDEKNTYKKELFTISSDEIEELKKIILQSADEIMHLKFWDRTCDDKECEYCKLRMHLYFATEKLPN